MKIIKEFVIDKAIEYCINNRLSVEKLRDQEVYKIEDVFFAQPIKTENSDGLKTDLASQPKPTLIYHIDTGEFEETEYTKQYLSM